ncbi:MAG TPA: discoidin domain-containing protein [Humisphaera sp.]
MREVYAKQLADRSAAGRRRLAEELLAEAAKAADNPGDQYVLLAGAANAAKEAASLSLCTQASEALAASYGLDPTAMRADAALNLKYSAATTADAAANVLEALDVVDSLVAADDLVAATKLCAALQAASAAVPSLRPAVQQKFRDVGTVRTEHDRVVPHLEKLKSSPADQSANRAVGSYLCLARGQWAAGLPLLAVHGTDLVRLAATRDLAAPAAAEAQAAVGDAWWQAGEVEVPSNQLAMRRRAAAWYAAALSGNGLTGLNRTRVEKRIAAVPKPVSPLATVVKAADAKWISQAAKYTASSSDKPPLPNLLDGRGGGYQNNGFAFHTQSEQDPFVVVDLTALSAVTGLEIGNRRDDLQSRAKTLTVWTSRSPNGPWREIWRAPDVQKQWAVNLEEPVAARFIKLGLRGTGTLHLFSVKVFGKKLE